MIKKNTVIKRLLSSVTAIFVAMMFSFSAEAASCKGKSQSSCSADSSCNWVSGYKRKDGVQVSGHCRAASGKANKNKTKQKSESKKSIDEKEKKSKAKKDKKDKKSKDKKAKKDKNAKDKKAKKDKKSKNKKSSKDTTNK